MTADWRCGVRRWGTECHGATRLVGEMGHTGSDMDGELLRGGRAGVPR